MNETVRQLYGRKSVRAYTDREISEDLVQEILYAAAMAPTAGNQQLYTVLRVTDPALLDSLRAEDRDVETRLFRAAHATHPATFPCAAGGSASAPDSPGAIAATEETR